MSDAADRANRPDRALERMLDRAVRRSRTSVGTRVARLRSKGYQIAQCALAAGLAWFIAKDLLGHPTPFFAPIAAVVSLGTSYGQRLRRVAEVTLGVAIGVLIGDLLVVWIGSGWWQLVLIVVLAMSIAFLLDGGQLFTMQAAVQSIVVSTLVPDPGAALTRWTDALVGGAVALVAATLVPAAPLRRPREQAAQVTRKIAELLRASADVMDSGEVEPALELLADARATDYLIRELQSASEEGLSVVASSPFRIHHRKDQRRMADLVDPLDRALRSTRVLVRNTAVSAYRRRPVPRGYAVLTRDLADAVDLVADELAANRRPTDAEPALLVVAQGTGHLERSDALSVEVLLAQLRSIIADLLLLTGMDPLEASDALPPTR